MQDAPHWPPSCHSASSDPVPFPSYSGPVRKDPPLFLFSHLLRSSKDHLLGQPWMHVCVPLSQETCSPALHKYLLSWSLEHQYTLWVCWKGEGCQEGRFCCPSLVVLTELLLSKSQPSLDPTLPACLSAAPARCAEGLGLVHLLSLLQAPLLRHQITAVHSFVSLEQDADVFQNFLQPQAVSFFGEESLDQALFPHSAVPKHTNQQTESTRKKEGAR